MATPRAKARKRPEAVRPDFNQAEHVVESLTRQNGNLAKQVAILEAAVAERDAFIQANAKALGLDVVQAAPQAPAEDEGEQ